MARESFHTYMNLDVVNNSSKTPQRLVFNMTRTITFFQVMLRTISSQSQGLIYRPQTVFLFLYLI